MDIDWNKDVEGEFGDTRRRLYPLKNDLGEVVAVDDLSRVWRLDSQDCPRLRNIAPKPVMREVWIGLCRDGTTTSPHYTPDGAMSDARIRGKNPIEFRRVVWRSDGHPVEDGYFYFNGDRVDVAAHQELCKSYDKLCAERDALKAECERKAIEISQMQIELDRRNALINGMAEEGRRMLGQLTAQRIIKDMKEDIVKSCDNCANGPRYSKECMAKSCAFEDGYERSWASWEPKR